MDVRDVYLEKALEQLREENEELKRKVEIYQNFIKNVKEILERK